ncbi:ankyrin repeat domain-containing protein [Lacticaseibacillus pantheris]|uniref:ankyrin repeat domain-containing protein n=1 Tax=Lacticaseibacillus pantheris TaxID=171523 RepID=UPI00265AA864|nr:ankyrin repeat domain-containing protein [Lacticaseibacillus pantheris]WKF84405.1 ankyrin repeat domain-containing protein [Lacticaseibacillus pantheris]
MKILTVFDAASEGTFQDFQELFNGDVNEVNKYTGLSVLMYCMLNNKLIDDKLKIIKFLIKNGADVNRIDKKLRRNALHVLTFTEMRPNVDYLLTVVKLLVEAGIDVNAQDKFGATPIKYLVTLNKLGSHEIDDVFKYLLAHGANPYLKDVFGKSPLDYANEYSWRSDFVDVVKEYEADGN